MNRARRFFILVITLLILIVGCDSYEEDNFEEISYLSDSENKIVESQKSAPEKKVSPKTNNDPYKKLKEDLKTLSEDIDDLFRFSNYVNLKNADCDDVNMKTGARRDIPEVGKLITKIEKDSKYQRMPRNLEKDFDEMKIKFNLALRCEEGTMRGLDKNTKKKKEEQKEKELKKKEEQKEKELMNKLRRLKNDVENLFSFGTNCNNIKSGSKTKLGRIKREIRGMDYEIDFGMNSYSELTRILDDIEDIYDKAEDCF